MHTYSASGVSKSYNMYEKKPILHMDPDHELFSFFWLLRTHNIVTFRSSRLTCGQKQVITYLSHPRSRQSYQSHQCRQSHKRPGFMFDIKQD